MRRGTPSVAVLGGGVGGMSAAHELVERGFRVTVYESKQTKARSIFVPGTGTAGRRGLPGEHGFRFFPSFYRHLPDTMKRRTFPFARSASSTRGALARSAAIPCSASHAAPRSITGS